MNEDDTEDAACDPTDEETAKAPWERLLEEMDTLATDLETRGWEVLPLAAPASRVRAPSTVDDTDEFGYIYDVSPADADRFRAWFRPDRFSKTDVYQATTAHNLFLLTVITEPNESVAILLAGVFDRTSLSDCKQAALERGRMYTHVQTRDGTRLGTFEHDEPEPFFPA